MKRTVGVNDAGARVGESHPRALLTDAEVQLLLGLRAEGWSYRMLAAKFEVSREAVRDWVKGRRRGQRAVAYRVVVISD